MDAVTKQIVARLQVTAKPDNLQDDNRANYIKRLTQVFGLKEIRPSVHQSGDPQWFEPKRPVTPEELEHALTGVRWNHRWATQPLPLADKKVKQFFNQDGIGVRVALILPQEDTGHHWFGHSKPAVPDGTICITSWQS